ncbi:hypothetical protein AB9Q94_00545 [Neisseria gonorrhoeae]
MTYGREGHSGKLPKGQPSNSCFKSNKNKKFGLLKNCIFLLMLTIDMSIDKKNNIAESQVFEGTYPLLHYNSGVAWKIKPPFRQRLNFPSNELEN